MKKVLFIAYYFPPELDAGVYRSLRFVKLLHNYGYDPVVLTVNYEDLEKRNCQIDEGLLKQLPEDLTIIRTDSGFPYEKRDALMAKRLFRIEWFFNFQKWRETAALWHETAYEAAAKAIEEHDIKLVYTSSAPHTAMLLGLKLKKRLGVKWVADMRDPYTDTYAYQFPTKFHWNAERRWEKKIFSQADKLIVNTPEVEKLYLKRGLTTPDKITHITNGFTND